MAGTRSFRPTPREKATRRSSKREGASGAATIGYEEARAKNVLGRVNDPRCGSSGVSLRSMGFIHAHANGNADLAKGGL